MSPFRLLCIAGFFGIFSSTISKSPVLPLFATSLGGSPSEVGAVAAVSAFAGIVASVPAGIFSDCVGRKRVMVAAGVIFATAPFLYLFVTTVGQLMLVRFYHGFATALFVPVAWAAVTDLFHGERGEKLGWFSTSTLLGRFLAPLSGGALLALLVVSPGLSFTAVYALCGIAGVSTLLLVLYLPPSAAGSCPLPHERPSMTGLMKEVLASRPILMTSLVEAGILFAYGTFETFLPLYALSRGHGAAEIGLFLAAQVLTLALTKPLMGSFSDRHGRKGQILAGAGMGALSIALIPAVGSFIALLLAGILIGLSLSVVTSATGAYIADVSRRETRGSSMGLLGSVMDIGHTAGPLAAGLLAEHYGLSLSFWGAAAVVLMTACAFLLTLGTKDETKTTLTA